jgi:hypothetical protein
MGQWRPGHCIKDCLASLHFALIERWPKQPSAQIVEKRLSVHRPHSPDLSNTSSLHNRRSFCCASALSALPVVLRKLIAATARLPTLMIVAQ